jgi:hypothetical protein
VPVERRVGKGFVGPLTDRPVSGVWARYRSRPPLPRGGADDFLAGDDFLADERAVVFFLAPRACFALAAARTFLRDPLDAFLARDLAGAVFLRPRLLAFLASLVGAFFRAFARRAPALPARVFFAVTFCRFVEPFRAELAAFRFAAFLAILKCPRLRVPN